MLTIPALLPLAAVQIDVPSSSLVAWLGLLAAVYVGFRMIESMNRPESHFATPRAAQFIKDCAGILCVACLAFAIGMVVTIL